MATELKLRRGTTAQHSSFTGAAGEVTVDTDKDTVVVHDGSTAGGFPLAKESGSTISAATLSVTGNTTLGDASGDSVTINAGTTTFAATGARITGDFSNATVADRVIFQTSTANSSTLIGAIPSGTGTVCSFQAYNNSDPTNAAFFNFGCSNGGTEARLNSAINGTGTYLPMTFYTSGSERMRIDTSGNVGIGTSSPTYKLTVNAGASTGAIKLSGDSSFIEFDNSSTKITGGGNLSLQAAGLTDFYTSGANLRMRIDSSGNVMVGTTTPINAAAGRGNITINGSSNAILNFGAGTVQKGYLYHNGTDFTLNNSVSGIIRFDTNDTERMRIDSSGNVGIGTSSPGYKLDVLGSSGDLLRVQDGTNGPVLLGTNSTGPYMFTSSAVALRFGTSGSERMRITSSGMLAINTTTAVSGNTSAKLVVKGASGADVGEIQVATNGTLAFDFRNSSGAQAGSITVNASSVAYNTSSDYRLKENIAPMTGALATVAQLNPVTYTWKTDGSAGQGFIAHELQEVVPDCVTGEKDAVDDDGNPVYQGIDTSFLVATLTAAIKEQQAIIESLKARLDAAGL